jgi:hypothetical protein
MSRPQNDRCVIVCKSAELDQHLPIGHDRLPQRRPVYQSRLQWRVGNADRPQGFSATLGVLATTPTVANCWPWWMLNRKIFSRSLERCHLRASATAPRPRASAGSRPPCRPGRPAPGWSSWVFANGQTHVVRYDMLHHTTAAHGNLLPASPASIQRQIRHSGSARNGPERCEFPVIRVPPLTRPEYSCTIEVAESYLNNRDRRGAGPPIKAGRRLVVLSTR